jgi:hypothetical protein
MEVSPDRSARTILYYYVGKQRQYLWDTHYEPGTVYYVLHYYSPHFRDEETDVLGH